MKNRAIKSVCIMAITCILASCSGSTQPPITTTTITTIPPAPTSTTAAISSPTQSEDPVSPPPDTAASSDAPPTTGSVLEAPTEKGKIPVPLAEFFHPSSNWLEGRYDVADQQNISGIKSVVSKCYSADPVRLELRLANHFEKLSFSVGQANDSNSSDQVLVVRVTGNNKQIEVHPIAFNSHQEFNIPVTDVNAATIEMYLDDSVSNCGGSVGAVIYDIYRQ
ncbi:hypothetical protein IV500_20420 [Paeniglutamicibacter antarcticus]|uniref:Glycosyl hydrolase family 98 putative carbohydrate-binding module domain-containing protein n=1 Tax=Arthrobacter terrae TaxID=2935737 RepID=A0A931CSP4_9MICC|nr:hypothetical protein [Arthrobacter terrae]MBG0741725.1 hypothetical protein [Arthrobacter terrae]